MSVTKVFVTKNSLLKRVNIKDYYYTKRATLESLLESRETELLPNFFLKQQTCVLKNIYKYKKKHKINLH